MSVFFTYLSFDLWVQSLRGRGQGAHLFGADHASMGEDSDTPGELVDNPTLGAEDSMAVVAVAPRCSSESRLFAWSVVVVCLQPRGIGGSAG